MPRKIKKFAVADCETDPFKHGRHPKPFLWGYYDGEIYEQFTKTEKFVEFIRDKDIILYAHNGGKFDWHFLTDYFDPYQKLLLIAGRIASVKIGACELRDSYSILPVPLAEYNKTEISYDIFEKEERNKPDNFLKISLYLEDDCVYLYELVEKFISDYGMNITLASSAMKFWKKNFLKEKYQPANKIFHETMVKFYYGGRVECFEKGVFKKDFKVFDINSAYPFAMLHNHPNSTKFIVDDKETPDITMSFFEVFGTSQGAFPYREKNKLFFPCDDIERKYFVTGWELKAARELGKCDVKIITSYYFPEKINFTDYVNHFYEMKKNAVDKKDYIMSKLLMNSLYGKFAANPDNYQNYEVVEKDSIEIAFSQGMNFYSFLGDNLAIMSEGLEERQKNYYNVATAASVTGFVRAMLFRQLCASENPIYCDTDSIACEGGEFNCGKELGQWENEGEFSEGAIAGKKIYAFLGKNGKYKGKYKKASKGVKLTPQEIYKVASGEIVNYQNIAPTFTISKENYFLERKIKMT